MDFRQFAALPQERQIAFMSSLTDDEIEALAFRWSFWARPEQRIPDGSWTYWLLCAGRGFGKTRVSSETVRTWVKQGYNYVNIIGATVDDVRDVMIEGESGILAVCPKDERPRYIANKRRLEWPNGAKSLVFSAEEPERFRGKQHSKLAADELAAWRYPESWDQAKLGLRLGNNPQAVISTTPRPTAVIRDLISDPNTIITRGSTYDNRSNLAASFVQTIIRKYEGTRLGRQELNAELLDDVAGALFTRDMFEKPGFRLRRPPVLRRIVVGVDPSGASDENTKGDDIGVVVAGIGDDGHGYVISDATCSMSPAGWGRQVVRAYNRFHADRVIGENNFGGGMVKFVIETAAKEEHTAVSYRDVRASRGKIVRAEPVAALYEQGRIHHIGHFPRLEDQLCGFTPMGYKLGGSPDRADAAIWALTDLMLGANSAELVFG